MSYRISLAFAVSLTLVGASLSYAQRPSSGATPGASMGNNGAPNATGAPSTSGRGPNATNQSAPNSTNQSPPNSTNRSPPNSTNQSPANSTNQDSPRPGSAINSFGSPNTAGTPR
jgi:hypothetical protein